MVCRGEVRKVDSPKIFGSGLSWFFRPEDLGWVVVVSSDRGVVRLVVRVLDDCVESCLVVWQVHPDCSVVVREWL